MSTYGGVIRYGLPIEITLTTKEATLAVMLLLSPARTDVPEGSSFAFVSGIRAPGTRGLLLSKASARCLVNVAGVKPELRAALEVQLRKLEAK
jgi:hypothetical protein